MVSAGLDTVPGNLIMGIAYLSSPHGQEIQKRAYEETMKVYPDGDAWEKCLTEEKVPYLTALVKEILRFWTVIPICLPRVSIKDIQYENATIPAGSMFYMVSMKKHRSRCPKENVNVTYRMHGQRTTTQRTSKTPTPSSRSAISTMPREQEHLIMATALARACASDRTWRIESYILPSFD